MLDMLSSEDEDDILSSDEDGEHNAWNLSLDVVGQSRWGMLVDFFLKTRSLRGQH